MPKEKPEKPNKTNNIQPKPKPKQNIANFFMKKKFEHPVVSEATTSRSDIILTSPSITSALGRGERQTHLSKTISETRSKGADNSSESSECSEYPSVTPGSSPRSPLDQDTDNVQISSNQTITNYQELDLAEKQISLSKQLDCEAKNQMNNNLL